MPINKSPQLIFFLVVCIFLFYAGIILWNIWPIDSRSLAHAGLVGDSFGILTSLFSGLAFAGLIITIWQQQEELSLTRDEIRGQHFENMLFRMIEMHNNIVKDFDIRYSKAHETHKQGDVVATGRDCFHIFHTSLVTIYNEKVDKSAPGAVSQTYDLFWKKHKRDLGHYLRYLYNIFKFINNSKIEDKLLYTNIVRAQLSDYELAILFYSCNSKHGKESFKPLVEKFHLLRHLPEEFLLDPSHSSYYSADAYT